MCGISGLIGNFGETNKFIKLSNNYLTRRGPDNFSYSHNISSSSLFCHSRLSIIDINDRANQPFKSECGRYILTYNGELYNFEEIKNDLITKGFKFRTKSDTEVFLYGLIYFGVKVFLSEKVEGMFAFAFQDLENKKTWLARDFYGQKPLSIYIDNSQLLFASDNRVISNYITNKTLSLSSLEGFLCLGYIPSSNFLFKNIFDLTPGYILEYDPNTNKTNFNSYKKEVPKKISSKDYSYKEFKKNLIESVKEVHIADVDVGIFLSSGLDSSLIALISKKVLNKDPLCFSIGYGLKKDEGNDIKIFCKENNLRSNIFKISDYEAGKEFINYPEIYDRPMSDSSCALISFLSKKCSPLTRCVISGDGADELFWGYQRYLKYVNLEKLSKLIPKQNFIERFFIGKKIWKLFYKNEIDAYFRFSNSTKGLIKYNNANWISNHIVEGDIFEYLPQNCLVKSDRASMHSSLEIRSPFLSRKLYKCSLNMSIETKKMICKNKLFHTKFYEELTGKKYYFKDKKGFSFNTKNIESIFPNIFKRSIKLSASFLKLNGYEPVLINKLTENNIVRWRLFCLGLYLEKLNFSEYKSDLI